MAMLKTNRKTFEELPSEQFLKTDEQASKFFIKLRFHEKLLGFDEETGGFLAIHKGHSPSGLDQEIGVCLILKNLGFGVILLDEMDILLAPDAKIGNRIFEIKRIFKSRNIQKAVLYQFRTSYRKSDNIVLHIDQIVNPKSVESALYGAALAYSSIRSVWVVFNNRLWQLDRKLIISNAFRIG